MALPNSGPLSFSAIAEELGVILSNVSLRKMSNMAGFSIPDAVSEFYGYGNITYTYYATYVASGPCTYDYWDIYTGSDGKYYATQDLSTYTTMFSIAEYWYEFLYYEPALDVNVYSVWTINSTSTTLTYDGNFSSSC
jgi:hypothetical protein